jgi:hypothetical protein
MDANRNHGSPKPFLKLKSLLWSAYLIPAAVFSAVLILAPWLGLAKQADFVLYRYVGIPRGLTLQLVLWPGIFALLYEILAVGIGSTAGRSRVLTVIKAAWADGSVIAHHLFRAEPTPTRRERWIAIGLAAAFALAFVVFLSKSLVWFKLLPEQHVNQALLDYGIDWGTPVFAFGGNLLYGFGIQYPLKGQLLPMEGTAHLFPVQFRIAATVALCFLSASLLFWCIGAAIGLKLIYRVVFAGLSALIATVPAGLNYVLWLLPPNFITYNFVAGLWSGEIPILCLFTAFLFFLVGTQNSSTRNLFASAGFATGAFAPILAYPYGSIYVVPILSVYCLALILTCEDRKEFYWKAGVSAVILAVMAMARVPHFISSLYAYAFSPYFFEFSTESPPSFSFNSIAAVFIFYFNDPRGLLSFMIALAASAIAACAAKGALRRLAIAVLACEAAIMIVTTINLVWWRIPFRGDYAELVHAPMVCAYFVLSMIIVAVLLDQRLLQWTVLVRSKYSSLIQSVIHRRKWVYGSFFVAMISGYWVSQIPPATLSDYPPKQTPSANLLIQELALAPGMQFRGRLMTLVPGTLEGPATPPMFYDIVGEYRRYLGNDLWVDPLAFNIPMLNEFSHFSSPLSFVFLRTFFGNEGDAFDRNTVVFTRFDLRIARLAGVKMVATDASTIAGGTIVYETKARDTDLRIFRIDDVNLGQYSPRRPRYARTAADAIASIKAVDFDPKLDVVVESDMVGNLVAATSAVLSVDRGPALVVRAASRNRSLLVLPFEYSHCLEMAVAGGRGQLLPVNLQQIGLLFEGEVEARITYRFGLFQNPRCRSEDLQRADNLKLREALLANSRGTLIRERPKLR